MNSNPPHNADRWGIIYCPTEGSWRTQRRWRRILVHLDLRGVPYDFVQSEGQGSVERLAAMLTQNGYRTLLVVGGDAALGDALNGIVGATLAGSDYPTLGIIPNGVINDFARYWDFHPAHPEATIDALLCGRTRRVDVGEVRLTTIGGEVLHRRFLNCVNVGLAASMIKLRRRNHTFWHGLRLLRELSSAFMLLLYRPSTRMHFTIGAEHYDRRITTLCIGSCHGFGQTPSAVPYNGQLDISAVKRPTLLHALTALSLLFKRRFLSQKDISVWRTPTIEMSQIGRATVSVDGHAIHHRITRLTATIHREAIRFMIP